MDDADPRRRSRLNSLRERGHVVQRHRAIRADRHVAPFARLGWRESLREFEVIAGGIEADLVAEDAEVAVRQNFKVTSKRSAKGRYAALLRWRGFGKSIDSSEFIFPSASSITHMCEL